MAARISQKKIVVIGGGTGVYTLLTGLKKYFSNLTAVVAMSDNGGSTGVLREEFGILPPGDIRRALVALSQSDNKVLSELFSYRFQEGNGLSGHNFGNLMLAALERLTGSFEGAIDEASRILQVRGKIIPVTLSSSHLNATLENGTVIRGETNIDIPTHDPNLRIEHVWLHPPSQANPNAVGAILDADLVIIGPGDLYTSIIPNILVAGVSEAIRETEAKVLYVVNVMTKYGETNGFRASDFVNTMEEYLGKNTIDVVLVNGKPVSSSRLKAYQEENAAPVVNDLIDDTYKVIGRDLIRPRGFVRHDPGKLGLVIHGLANGLGNGHRRKLPFRETKETLFAP